MQTLIITTQHRENYGAHDWNGEGECPQHWKYKGGSTYFVTGLTGKQINKIAQHGIPTLSKLIESRTSCSFVDSISNLTLLSRLFSPK